tara:strand:+ start:872 stop:1438 length:567 start_codon:yes stop_codon:yes gene_type:complete
MNLDTLHEELSNSKYRNYMSEKYITFLSESFNIGWQNTFKKINKDLPIEDFVLLKLILIHPSHISSFFAIKTKPQINSKQQQIQGKRIFTENLYKECESERFWGYKCPFQEKDLVADHAFPYSLGGPTKGANLRCLCKWHNMIKANDIHCYPWEDLIKDYQNKIEHNMTHWIDNQFDVFVRECNITIN